MSDAFLNRKLAERIQEGALRSLPPANHLVDFCSNDYLGLIHDRRLQVESSGAYPHGSSGSRLISGNYDIIVQAEQTIASFHEAEAALIFNSGYDANLGLLSCIASREDTILYDALSHASIRDGIRLSHARSFSFAHNNLIDLGRLLQRATGRIFVVTESVFSMDGDLAPLADMAALCDRYGAALIVDEAHATGVIGSRGEGVCQHLALHQRCYARVITFGKALGCHGAAVVGSRLLCEFLINFSRPFIYTTAMPPASSAVIMDTYRLFPGMQAERLQLQQRIEQFRNRCRGLPLTGGEVAIQGLLVPGNDRVAALAAALSAEGFDVRPIRSPTVAKGTERLRIVLHAFNSAEDVEKLTAVLLRSHE